MALLKEVTFAVDRYISENKSLSDNRTSLIEFGLKNPGALTSIVYGKLDLKIQGKNTTAKSLTLEDYSYNELANLQLTDPVLIENLLKAKAASIRLTNPGYFQ